MKKLMLAALAATVLVPVAAQAQPAGDMRRDRMEDRHDMREARQEMRDARRDLRDARHDMRDARQDWRHDGRDDRRDWRDARHDDWRAYREAHRDVYRLRPYAGPRGWTYRAVTPGYRFAPTFYAQRYWIANPMTYRLPAPGYGLRWVRYGNDAVLVRMRNGVVVQVLNDFFW